MYRVHLAKSENQTSNINGDIHRLLRTDNTMTKRTNDNRTNNDLQNISQKTKRLNNTNPTKTVDMELTSVFLYLFFLSFFLKIAHHREKRTVHWPVCLCCQHVDNLPELPFVDNVWYRARGRGGENYFTDNFRYH